MDSSLNKRGVVRGDVRGIGEVREEGREEDVSNLFLRVTSGTPWSKKEVEADSKLQP